MGLIEAQIACSAAAAACLPFPLLELLLSCRWAAELQPAAAANIMRGSELSTVAVQGHGRLTAGRVAGQAIVPYAAQCRWLALPVHEDGRMLMALADLRHPGCSIELAHQFDLSYELNKVSFDIPASDLTLGASSLPVEALGVLAAAELVGASESCLKLATQYAKDRTQFGNPIGSYQAIKHSLANDFMMLDNARVASQYLGAAFDNAVACGWALESEACQEAMTALHVAKSYCGDAARCIAEDSLQIHGAIAMSWELDVHRMLRRVIRLSAYAGQPQEHRAILSRSLLSGKSLGIAGLA